MKGTIKWYNARKGYGFIQGESAVPDGTYLNEGDKVEYEIEETDKGQQAKDVKKV